MGSPTFKKWGTPDFSLVWFGKSFPLYTTQIQAFSNWNASLWAVVNCKLTAAFSSPARGLPVPLTHLRTLSSQTERPALTNNELNIFAWKRAVLLGAFGSRALYVPGWEGQSRRSWGSAWTEALHDQGSRWALEIIGQFVGSWSASLNITLRQIFLNLDYSPCQDPLAVCQGPELLPSETLECFFHSLLVDVRARKSRWSIVLHKAQLFIFPFQKRKVRGI